jgi:hypothetical protein
MRAHRITTTVPADKSVTLDKLPFPAGQPVEIIVLPQDESHPAEDRYPLRGTSIEYKNPTEPVAENDWEAAQ